MAFLKPKNSDSTAKIARRTEKPAQIYLKGCYGEDIDSWLSRLETYVKYVLMLYG